MKVLFHLGHPAHFHLFKNVIRGLKNNGHTVFILIKKKDILEELLESSEFEYENVLPKGRKDSLLNIAIGQLKQSFKVFLYCTRKRPDLLVGTSVAISHVGKILGIPSINVNEDDVDAVPFYARLSYPWASVIIAPEGCSTGKWHNKTIYYNGYHELSYLHPNHFTADIATAKKYIDISSPYFIIRFAKLGAHHDKGIRGLSDKIALKVVEILKPYGNVLITSERTLDKDLNRYRIKITPSDMHHVMAYASLYIGDSQTMAAEAGVLGVPFIRFNDFVGRISYLEEMENKYKLGFGVKTNEVERLFGLMLIILHMENARDVFQKRRNAMLSEKIDTANFLITFIEEFLKSRQAKRHIKKES